MNEIFSLGIGGLMAAGLVVLAPTASADVLPNHPPGNYIANECEDAAFAHCNIVTPQPVTWAIADGGPGAVRVTRLDNPIDGPGWTVDLHRVNSEWLGERIGGKCMKDGIRIDANMPIKMVFKDDGTVFTRYGDTACGPMEDDGDWYNLTPA